MRIYKLLVGVALTLALGTTWAEMALRLGMQLPETHPSYQGALEIQRTLEQASGGTMKLRIFPSSQLGDFKAMVAQTQAGELDMVMTGYPDMSYVIPELKLIGAPYVIRDYDHLRAVLKSPYGQKMNAKFIGRGMRVLDIWYEGARHTTASKAINSMADLKGMKMRTPNVPFLIAYAKAVGAIPAPVAFSEVYLALQTRQVDAQENPLPTIDAAKLYEVQKHIALTGHFIASTSILFSEKKWHTLSAKQQRWVTMAAVAGGKVSSKLIADKETSLMKTFSDRGITFTKPDIAPFRAAMKDYYAELESEFGQGEIAKIMSVK